MSNAVCRERSCPTAMPLISEQYSFPLCLGGIVTLLGVRRLVFFHDPESYAGRNLVLPAGSPIPEGSEGRGQTKTLALQVGGWA